MTYRTNDPYQRLRDLQAEVAAAQAEVDRLEALDPARRLAEELHRARCHYNHIDMCGWDYEQGDRMWAPGTTHARYLEQARKLMNRLPGKSVDEILEVVSALD